MRISDWSSDVCSSDLQFLVSHTNKRNDDWGGSWPNRMRLPVEIVTRMREAVGKDFIIVYRLSMLGLIPDGQRWEEVGERAKAVEKGGATTLNTETERGPCRRSA